MKKLITYWLLLLPVWAIAQEEEKKKESFFTQLIPHYGSMQFAGGTGLLSTELGYEFFKERLKVGGYYGVLPTIRRRESVHNFGLSITYQPKIFPVKKGVYSILPYINLRINKIFGDGNRTFTTLPSSFPEGYYPPTSINLFPQFGVYFRKNELKSNYFKSVGFYASAVTNDIYIAHYFPNKYYHWGDLFSMALGVVVQIK